MSHTIDKFIKIKELELSKLLEKLHNAKNTDELADIPTKVIDINLGFAYWFSVSSLHEPLNFSSLQFHQRVGYKNLENTLNLYTKYYLMCFTLQTNNDVVLKNYQNYGIFDLLLNSMLDINVKEIWVTDLKKKVNCTRNDMLIADSIIILFFNLLDNEDFISNFNNISLDCAWFHILYSENYKVYLKNFEKFGLKLYKRN